MQTIIKQLFSGRLQTLEPEGQSTGIYKFPVDKVKVETNGFVGDIQADRRFHGGPEKAVHQYAVAGYQTILDSFPNLTGQAVPGSLGENVSCDDLHDTNVHIGDIYRLGKVLLQVSQPRSPCWKINHKFDQNNLSRFIEENLITGWYYRVLENGEIKINDTIELEQRPNKRSSVADFNRIVHQHRPDLNQFKDLQNLIGLTPEWSKKINQRTRYLEKLDY